MLILSVTTFSRAGTCISYPYSSTIGTSTLYYWFAGATIDVKWMCCAVVCYAFWEWSDVRMCALLVRCLYGRLHCGICATVSREHKKNVECGGSLKRSIYTDGIYCAGSRAVLFRVYAGCISRYFVVNHSLLFKVY